MSTHESCIQGGDGCTDGEKDCPQVFSHEEAVLKLSEEAEPAGDPRSRSLKLHKEAGKVAIGEPRGFLPALSSPYFFKIRPPKKWF